jgi:hypothetical protein
MRWLDRVAYHFWRVVLHLDDHPANGTEPARVAAKGVPEGAF